MGLFDKLRYRYSPSTIRVELSPDQPMVLNMDIASLYKTQANLRTVVSFLSEQIAQLPIKSYRRTSDNDRQRDTECVSALLLKQPNTYQTKYEFIEMTMSEFLLYGETVWYLSPDKDTISGWSLDVLPESWLFERKGGTIFNADAYVYRTQDGKQIEVPSKNMVIIKNYSPNKPALSLSPVYSLRDTLFEQMQASTYRRQVWQNGGRMSAYITRPKDVEAWTQEAADRFKTDIRDNWTSKGAKAGGLPVLEDGMEIKTVGFSAREQEWSKAIELSREEVCGVYHISPSVVWNINGQTYASAKDNARALYSDCLMLYLTRLQERINGFLLPKLAEESDIYVEFDIQAKLQGSFEEQATYLTSATGAPWLTRNEARARMNLPAVDGGDDIITPLNVAIGGAGYGTETGGDPESTAKQGETPRKKTLEEQSPVFTEEEMQKKHEDIERRQKRYAEVYRHHAKRQLDYAKTQLGAKSSAKVSTKSTPAWWDSERWNRELAEDLMELAEKDNEDYSLALLERLQVTSDAFSADKTKKYLQKMCDGRAESINKKTLDDILDAIASGDDLSDLYARFDERGDEAGAALLLWVKGWSERDIVKQATFNGYVMDKVYKKWMVTSHNPRPSHAAVNGEIQPSDEPFSIGGMYPGDSERLDAAQVCNCKCTAEYFRYFEM